jgi:hypothetical protein
MQTNEHAPHFEKSCGVRILTREIKRESISGPPSGSGTRFPGDNDIRVTFKGVGIERV